MKEITNQAQATKMIQKPYGLNVPYDCGSQENFLGSLDSLSKDTDYGAPFVELKEIVDTVISKGTMPLVKISHDEFRQKADYIFEKVFQGTEDLFTTSASLAIASMMQGILFAKYDVIPEKSEETIEEFLHRRFKDL